MRWIENPEDEYQKEFERKQKLRIKARQKYNEGNNIPFICSLCKLQNCYKVRVVQVYYLKW